MTPPTPVGGVSAAQALSTGPWFPAPLVTDPYGDGGGKAPQWANGIFGAEKVARVLNPDKLEHVGPVADAWAVLREANPGLAGARIERRVPQRTSLQGHAISSVSGGRYGAAMRAAGTFAVTAFVPTELAPSPEVATGLPVGVATMEKEFQGEVVGRSATLFTAAFDQAKGVGTYVAMESFEGSLHGRTGAFNFAHSATTSGSDRTAEFFTIVPSSGTGDLAGISGGGGLAVDADGTHRVWFDYELG